MNYRFLTEEEKRQILRARLHALERDHFIHALDGRIGVALAGRQEGEPQREAHEMVERSQAAQLLILETHHEVGAELEALELEAEDAD